MSAPPISNPKIGHPQTPGQASLSFEELHWVRLGREAVNDFRVRALNAMILRLLADPPGDILDLGCGAGLFCLEAAKRSLNVFGIDISESQIGLAQDIFTANSLSAERMRCCTLEQLVAEGRRFDQCVALDVIEHVEDRPALLRTVREAVRPGGQLIVCVPAGPTFYDRRDELSGHYLRYDPVTLRAELESSGWTVKDLRYWNWLGWLSRKVWELGPRRDEFPNYEFRYSTSFSKRIVTQLMVTYFTLFENFLHPPVGMSLIARART